MAIQNRRGSFDDFDPTKMVAGEFAVVQDDDPDSSTGRSLYVCFEPGVVKRIADYEDIQDIVADVAEGYISDFDDAVTALTTLIPATEQAKDDANAAATAANAIVTAGNSALGQGIGTTNTNSVEKIVTLPNFQLVTGGVVAVKFEANAYTNTKLNINSTGLKYVKYFRKTSNGTTLAGLPENMIMAGDIATFMYDGEYYVLLSVFRKPPIWIDFQTSVSSLPATRSSHWIDENMICTRVELGHPAAIRGDFTVTTANESVTVAGEMVSGQSTTIKLLLQRAVSVTVSS